jgi:hypothetical protein
MLHLSTFCEPNCLVLCRYCLLWVVGTEERNWDGEKLTPLIYWDLQIDRNLIINTNFQYFDIKCTLGL